MLSFFGIPRVHLSAHQGLDTYTPLPALLISHVGGEGEGGGIGGQTADHVCHTTFGMMKFIRLTDDDSTFRSKESLIHVPNQSEFRIN
jgi:hypothetical protein